MAVTISDLAIDDERLIAELSDGRAIAVPITWFPRLLGARPDERTRWELCAGGKGIHWPSLDEDIGLPGLLRTSS